jgi:PAS domain S-box-containing protein
MTTINVSDKVRRVKKYSKAFFLIWVIIILSSFLWNYSLNIKETKEIAEAKANAYFQKDFGFRNWASQLIGVYVPIDERIKPNKYLTKFENREITTPNGDSLTFMNHAYMVHQFFSEYQDSNNIISKLTSFAPSRPESKPDKWELAALEEFSNGVVSKSEFVEIDNVEYFRMMQPIFLEESCLKCHENSKYKVGDLRGGISLMVPMKIFWNNSRENRSRIVALYIFLLFAGLFGIYTIVKRFLIKLEHEETKNKTIIEQDERLKLALAATNAGVWDWNIDTREAIFDDRWAAICGYSLEELEPINVDTWNKLCHPEDLVALDEELQRLFAKEMENYVFEIRMKHKNNSWVWVQIRGKVIEWSDDGLNAQRMVGITIDVTNKKEAESQFLAIMNSLDAGVYVSDMTTYELLFINNSILKDIGNVRGKLCWQALQKDQTGPCSFCTNSKLLNKNGSPGETYTWEFQNTITNKWYLIKDKAIRWHDGRIVRLEIATDITEKRQAKVALEESEERFRTTFNQAYDPTFIAEIVNNKVPRIVDINEAVTSKFGHTRENAIGKPMNVFLAEESEEIIFQRIKKLLSGEPISFESMHKIVDGTLIPVDVSAKKIEINGKYYLYIIQRDISERKQWENEIVEMKNRLLEENASKDKFFSIISHDLKAPFSALLGIAQLLEESYDDFSDTERKEMIHIYRNSSNNIYQLLEGLLEWSRANSGRMEFELKKININEITTNVIEILHQNAKVKKILLNNSIEKNTFAFADIKMLTTILRNLITNAIKFTPENGAVDITSEIVKEKLVISVLDNGIGMKPDDIKKLFRIDVHHTTVGTQNETGTGVGLILCKELVEKHGGNIWVESKVGKGSTFNFSLPINRI